MIRVLRNEEQVADSVRGYIPVPRVTMSSARREWVRDAVKSPTSNPRRSGVSSLGPSARMASPWFGEHPISPSQS
jgi:hypothetical protein